MKLQWKSMTKEQEARFSQIRDMKNLIGNNYIFKDTLMKKKAINQFISKQSYLYS